MPTNHAAMLHYVYDKKNLRDNNWNQNSEKKRKHPQGVLGQRSLLYLSPPGTGAHSGSWESNKEGGVIPPEYIFWNLGFKNKSQTAGIYTRGSRTLQTPPWKHLQSKQVQHKQYKPNSK